MGANNIIVNERGAFGQAVQSYDREEITVIAHAAIAVGTVVEILSTNLNTTTGEYEVSAAAVAGNGTILGVALEAASAQGDRIRVCRRGICSVLTAAAVAVDKPLVVVTTAGKVDDATEDGTKVRVGHSLTSSSGADTITAYIML